MFNRERNYTPWIIGAVIAVMFIAICAIASYTPSAAQQGYYDGGYSVPVYVPVLGGSHYGGSYHSTTTTIHRTTTTTHVTTKPRTTSGSNQVRPSTIRVGSSQRPVSRPSYNVRPSPIRMSRSHM